MDYAFTLRTLLFGEVTVDKIFDTGRSWEVGFPNGWTPPWDHDIFFGPGFEANSMQSLSAEMRPWYGF